MSSTRDTKDQTQPASRPSDEIESIDTGEMCYQTDPCLHDVTLKYKDGTKERFGMSAIEIAAKYQKLLSPQDKEHFAYVTEPTYWQREPYADLCKYYKNSDAAFFKKPKATTAETANTPKHKASCVIL